MGTDSKKQFNVRVSESTTALIDKAAYLLHKTKANVVEDAVLEYAARHHITERYQLNIKNGMMILLKLDGETAEVVEMEALNGVPPEVIAQRYSSRFHQAVPLVVDKK